MMVPDSPHVKEVLLGEDGVFGNAKPGTLVIDFASIRPDVTVVARRAGGRQGHAPRSTRRSPAVRPVR